MSHTEAPAGHAPRHRWEHLAERERRIVEAVLHRAPVARDTNRTFIDERAFGQRMADRIAGFGGSWPFILLERLLIRAPGGSAEPRQDGGQNGVAG